MMAASVTLIRGADLVASPWKNGGGVTREVAAFPEGASMDAFAWRVSVADVAQAGPFSRFPGVDRTLVLLDGAGMILDESAQTHALMQPLDIARFAGESAIDARLVDGATRDFNLMVRRDAARGALDVWRAGEARRVEADTALFYCAQGSMRVRVNGDEPVALEQGDTLRIDHVKAHIATEGDGALLAIALRETQ
ncbi:hypothetical protein AWB75_03296 [Caballeronia catudaia]|uniref:Histidine utilization protein HutD n=1 Tax=Caballeronia catudaia TaxID=1777136 RepID=A0A158BDF5_9BURK|nr:HutD family protein [Caballeronia catudaia]SAK67930.1 hypothetical protein AWB75_03296 [Caballeronia catudaia]